jgi:hypothetical protein
LQAEVAARVSDAEAASARRFELEREVVGLKAESEKLISRVSTYEFPGSLSNSGFLQNFDENFSVMSNEDLVALKESLDLMQLEASSAQLFISTLESRILDLDNLNREVCEEKEALLERVRLLEEMVVKTLDSGNVAPFEPEFHEWMDSSFDEDDLVRNINYINFCKAAADICRSSEAIDLKEVKLLRLISSFLLHRSSDMDFFKAETILVESSSVDEIERFQAMNNALCLLVDKLTVGFSLSKQPNGWC